MNVAVIGLGLIGGSLLRALAAHGHRVTGYDIGAETREAAAALARAADAPHVADPSLRPMQIKGVWQVAGSIPAAVEGADVVVLAVPWDGHDELVSSLPLAGQTVISCVNPLAFDTRGAHGQAIDGGEGSAAEHAAELAPEATVVGAFHNVSAVLLWGDDDYLDEDVLCVGDSDEGKQVAMELARAVTGREGISAGKLRLARVLEPMTAVLISINRKYKAHSGIRITGLPDTD